MSENAGKSTELIEDAGISIRRDSDKLAVSVIDGPDAGKQCPIGSDNICVGSDELADLVLLDGTVSRKHLLVRKTGEGAWIQDQESTNGTFFEGSRVKEMVLGPGATIRVGQTLLKIVPREQNLCPEPSADDSFYGVVGACRKMREIFAILEEVAQTDLTVLIEGETGTGKEALAEAIHQHSQRSDKPFVIVDCTTIPRDLAESELFGHRKGSFTGAMADRTGLFEQGAGGTLFIDEVGDLTPQLQPKLLRALERHEIRPVGAEQTTRVDARVIAATNTNLKEKISDGSFREDLFYRLAVVSIRLPPLRERGDDLGRLAEHFLKEASGGKIDLRISASALARFTRYEWPGNVRELRNVVERAVALHRAEKPDVETVLAEMARGLGESSIRDSGQVPFKQAKSQVVDAFEREYLADLMKRTDGNVSQASREARMDRHHLADLLKKHGIKTK